MEASEGRETRKDTRWKKREFVVVEIMRKQSESEMEKRK